MAVACPAEFEELLSAEGRKILAGTHPLCGALLVPGKRFTASLGLIDPRKAERLRRALEKTLLPLLEEMAQPIPPQTLTDMTENYGELLPKTARVRTAYLDHPRARAFRAAEAMGLTTLLRSQSLVAFAAAVCGRRLRPRGGMQVLCYTPGDYAGPHNDHHPEDPEAAGGYTDVHLTLCGPAVAHQYLVYARRGHLSEVWDVATLGGVTVYRLPFWHYTTPLVARPGQEGAARRWVLLGTYLDAPPRARRAIAPPPGVKAPAD